MKRQLHRRSDSLARHHALLVALSEDLALPLVQIKTGLELMQDANFAKPLARQQTRAMNLSVEAGFQLIEAYRLLLASDQLVSFDFQPVSIGAVLEEVAHGLTPFAQEYSTKLEVDIQGRLTPVLVHQPSLTAAMQALGFSLIRAQAAQSERAEYRLILGAHRTVDNVIAAGAFSDVQGLSDRSLRAAHSLVGQARQPLPSVPPGTASGILVADMLCANLWQPLRSAAHKSLGGLATTLPTSKQLQFV
ncbi:MAG TPA: hypothetical protein VFT49_02135 [Candidatus Saccharimonadales bacterium]|nr:hypothetical protein [Candidatus Saccharimonadales bacterium]